MSELVRGVLLVALSVILGDAAYANPLSDAAPKSVPIAGAPKHSDVCFSSRWPRPLNKNDPHDTFAAAKAFAATRIDWSYPTQLDFVRQSKEQGYSYFGTISAELEGANASKGRDKSYRGNVVGNPELDFLAARGDINGDVYPQIVMKHVVQMLDAGADGIFVDDPGLTYHNAVYNGGGYGDASCRKFRDFLARESTADERTAWGLPADLSAFDYAEYVREHEAKPPEALGKLFFRFHQQSVDEFYKKVRRDVDKHAGRHVPFACNNWSVLKQDEFPFRDHFDFWIGETSVQYSRPTAKLIYDKVAHARSLGKMQYFSPPNDGPDFIATREEYVALTRKLIATSYACGSATLVPWDVWRRGPSTPRFFGTPEEFGDLYSIVSKHSDLFDGREEVFATGAGVETKTANGVPQNVVKIDSAAETLLVTVRAPHGDDRAPIVIHLVDWADKPQSRTAELDNPSFGGEVSKPLDVQFIGTEKNLQKVNISANGTGMTKVSLPPLQPYGLLVVQP